MVGHHQIVELICCVIIYILVSCSTKGYTGSVGGQHGNTHSHRIYKLRGSPIWKHTFTQDIQAPWESSMETHIHTRGYTISVGAQHTRTFTQDIQAPWEPSMETHNRRSLGPDMGRTG